MKNKSFKSLTEDQVAFYKENGYLLTARPLFTDQKFQNLYRVFAELLEKKGNKKGNELDVPHFDDQRLFDFLMADEVLNIIEDLIGPNIGLWSSHFIVKEPKTGKRTPWHEDSAYWEGRFDRYDDIVTLWLAIEPSYKENGCMGVIPGTNGEGISTYREIDTDNEIFTKEISNALIDDPRAVWFELEPNYYSLHDSRIVHGANANTSNIRRTGYTMRYFNTDLSMVKDHPGNAQHKVYHCRGENRGNNPLITL
jgi:ectoine hydroxylase-related dioxygenase (phytanoyl-CoA dioxygenase family)